MAWFCLLLSIAITVLAQVMLKAGTYARTFRAQLLDYHTLAGLGLYGLAAILYILALRRIPLSVALPCTALSYVAAILIGHLRFGEAVSALHAAGAVVICCGVVMLALAS